MAAFNLHKSTLDENGRTGHLCPFNIFLDSFISFAVSIQEAFWPECACTLSFTFTPHAQKHTASLGARRVLGSAMEDKDFALGLLIIGSLISSLQSDSCRDWMVDSVDGEGNTILGGRSWAPFDWSRDLPSGLSPDSCVFEPDFFIDFLVLRVSFSCFLYFALRFLNHTLKSKIKTNMRIWL